MQRLLLKYFLLIFLICSFPAAAQYYNLAFRNYSSNNGLSQSEVNCVFRDNQGFVWIGTEFGLTRYDGRVFTNYYHKVGDSTSIAENTIKDITQDNSGALWMAIGSFGVSKLELFSKKFRNFKPEKNANSILSEKVRCIIADNHNRIWIGLEEGISVYDNNISKFRNLSHSPGSNEELWVNCFQKDPSGTIWVGAKNGLYFSNNDLPGLRLAKVDKSIRNVNAIEFEKNGRGWLATSDGLYSFICVGNDSIILSKPAFLKANEQLHDIEFDPRGNLWISSLTKGLRIYFPTTGYFDELKEDFNSSRGLTSNRIRDIYNDGNGGMWVSGENGVQSFHDDAQRFNIYAGLSATAERIRGSTIYGIHEEGDIILLATSGGMIIFDRRNSRYLPLVEKFEETNQAIRFREVYPEGQGRWWVTSDAGLFEIVKDSGVYILHRPATIRSNYIRTMDVRSYLRRQNILWLATASRGLIRYDIKNNTYTIFQKDINDALSLPDNVTYKVIEDRDSNIIICHDAGLSILYKGAKVFENYGINDSVGKRLTNKQAFDIYDDGNNVWIGTIGGGLNILDKTTKSITYLTTEDGLCNDAIYKMVPVNDSLLYLGTNKGLSLVNMKTRKFQNFDINDGMPSEEFNMYSGFVSAEGEVYMGTTSGLISFKPEALRKNNLPLGIYLSKFRKNGIYQDDSATAIINKTRDITTKYGEDLFLEFSPLVFYTSAENKLNYKIREQGEEWIDGEVGGLLPLVRLEPGSYTIDVRMVNDNGLRNSNIMTLKLEVLPPFWKTIWFRLLGGIFLVVITYFTIRAYINRRLERQRVEFMKQQAVEQERLRISAELHDDIGGGLTAIRLLSEMSLEHDKGSDSRKYLERISSSSNDIIQKMNEIVWALNNNNDNLESLISYTRLYTVSYLDDLDIGYHFDTPEQIPPITVLGKNRRSIFLLVKESLNNIVKHANATTVDVNISIDEKLNILIRDNGIGFTESKIVKGNGLNNMHRRVQALRGEMVILNGEGTTIKFKIPIKNLYA